MIKVGFLGSIGKGPEEKKAETLADFSAQLKADSSLMQWSMILVPHLKVETRFPFCLQYVVAR